MKWFKHDTDADDSEGLDVLVREFGLEGYGRWFRLLETIGKKMERGSDRCHVEYTESKWCEILKVKRKKLSCFLEVIQKELKTNVKRNGNKLRIECPNLLKKRDEYSGRSRYSTDNVFPKNKEVRNKNKDKPNLTRNILSSDKYSIFKNRFERVWKLYPNKIGKQKAQVCFIYHIRTKGMKYFKELVFAVCCEIRTQKNANRRGIRRSHLPGNIFFDTGYKDHEFCFENKTLPSTYRRPYKL